jgi:hypothetical protein
VFNYTDFAEIGGEEISLKHLVTNVSRDFHVTAMCTSQVVIDSITSNKPQVPQVVLPESFGRSRLTFWQSTEGNFV